MPILTKPPEWHNPGSEPPANKKQGGWEVDERPPAGWFNWLFHRTYQSLLELSAAIAGHRDNKDNPHSVTPSQIGAETPAGAQAKVAAHAGTGGSAHATATQDVAGFMSPADKAKLDDLDASDYAEAVAEVDGKRAGYAVYAP